MEKYLLDNGEESVMCEKLVENFLKHKLVIYPFKTNCTMGGRSILNLNNVDHGNGLKFHVILCVEKRKTRE